MGRRSGTFRATAITASALLLVFAAGRSVSATQSASLAAIKAEISLRDFDAAAAALAPLAAGGDPEAEYLLGVFNLEGIAGPVNSALARHWLEAAAAQGHARAAAALGTLLAHATPADLAGSRHWLARARELGYRPAQTATNQRSDAPPSQHDTFTVQALWRAAERGDVAKVRALATASSATAQDEFGRGALARAAEAGSADAIAVLVQHGAAINAADRYGITPLMLAADSASEAAVAALLRAGAAVNAADHRRSSAGIAGCGSSLRRVRPRSSQIPVTVATASVTQ